MSIDYHKLVTRASEDLIQFPLLTSNSYSLSLLEKLLLGHMILLSKPRFLVELGVYQALSTHFMCEFLDMNGLPSTVIGFDVPEQISEVRINNSKIRIWEEQGRLILVPGTLPSSLKDWANEEKNRIDLALVDATHNYWSVSRELELLWPALSENGYIICHDYSPAYQGVCEAIDYFVSTHPGAMAAPLISSDISLTDDYRSSLIVLRRRPYRFQKRAVYQKYKWPELKERIKAVRLIGGLWSWIRPFFKQN
jgi:hypothetical protein